jgi:hypothetical protein
MSRTRALALGVLVPAAVTGASSRPARAGEYVNADGLTRAPMVHEGEFNAPEGHAPRSSRDVREVGGRLVCPECASLPPNVKKHGRIGSQKDLPEGFLVCQEKGGGWGGRLMVTPLKRFEPRPCSTILQGGVGTVTGRMDVSDDGRWVVTYRPWQPILVPLDGSGAVDLPDLGRVRWEVDEERCIGFWHSYPGGGDAIWIASNRGIWAVEVDLCGSTPTFGEPRRIARLDRGIGAGWMRDAAVAATHAFGGLDAPWSMLTLLDGGTGGVAGPERIWKPSGQARFACGCHMSWDGMLACYNPGGTAKKPSLYDRAIPAGGTHVGPLIVPFAEAGSADVDAADLELHRSLSVNWAPREYYSASHDWHEWPWGASAGRFWPVCRRAFRMWGRGCRLNAPDRGQAQRGSVRPASRPSSRRHPLPACACGEAVYTSGCPCSSPTTPSISGPQPESSCPSPPWSSRRNPWRHRFRS